MPDAFDPQRLDTVQLVPITAFDAQGNLNLDPMRALTQRLFEAGVRCFIPCAGSAEFHSLAEEEIVAAVDMTRQVVGNEALVLAPVGQQIHRAIRLGSECVAVGADGLLVMPLDFPYLSNEGARDYYRALMDEVACPTLLYKKADVPSDALLLELADLPHLVGVKYAVNDIDAFTRIVQADGGRIHWSCGSAERFCPFFMMAGATGYTSGAGNLCPRITLAMHAALAAQDFSEAMRLQRILRPIEDYRARSGSSYNISMLKHAIRLTGLDFGEVRPPQRRLTADERREIDALVRPILDAEESMAQPATAAR